MEEIFGRTWFCCFLMILDSSACFTGPDSADSASFLLLSLHCFLVISAWVRRVSVMNSHFELRGNWFCDDDSVLNLWESMSNQRNFVEFCWIWCFCVDSVEINGGLRWLRFLPLMNLWSFFVDSVLVSWHLVNGKTSEIHCHCVAFIADKCASEPMRTGHLDLEKKWHGFVILDFEDLPAIL